MEPDRDRIEDWDEPDELDRVEVLIRSLYTLLFSLVISVLESVLAVVVIFQLLFSLVTRRLPGARVQEFANSITAYFYQMLRYCTHNDHVVPFPFSDFPIPPEPPRPAYAGRRAGASEAGP